MMVSDGLTAPAETKQEAPILLIAPIVAICIVLALPLYAGEGEKDWSRRPVAALMVTVIAVSLAILTGLASKTSWSPVVNAWSADAIQPKFLRGRTPLERQGAIVFQQIQCRNCHWLDGVGGKRGPELDRVTTKLTESQMIRQVLQGDGNMPAYGSALSPQQVTALVRFLETLHGSERPAQVGSRAHGTGADVQRSRAACRATFSERSFRKYARMEECHGS
jgi:ubiquinol-cytochrome c reductase cytochrome b subunit